MSARWREGIGTVTAVLLGRRATSISIISIAAAAWLSSAAAAGAAPPPVPTHAAVAERVRAREQAFARTMAERDLAAFAGFVSQEAVFLGRTVLRGRATVVEGWKPLFEGKKPPFSWQPETVEVIDSGTLAISRGPVFDAEGKRSGTFTSTWRLETDGEWRVLLDSGCPPCACP